MELYNIIALILPIEVIISPAYNGLSKFFKERNINVFFIYCASEQSKSIFRTFIRGRLHIIHV